MGNKNEVVLTFAGDAASLEKAADKVVGAAGKVAGAVEKQSSRMEKAYAKAASGAAFLASGLTNLEDSVEGVTRVTRLGEDRANRYARAQANIAKIQADLAEAINDTQQAIIDYAQAQRDASQAGLDAEQAALDVEKAQRDLNSAIREHGANSIEARQAALDLKQAQEDLAQAGVDLQRSQADANEALVDQQGYAADAALAQVDLRDAQREASDITGWRDWVSTVSGFAPLIMTAVGAMQLFQAANEGAAAASVAAWGRVLGPFALVIGAMTLAWNTAEYIRDWFKNDWVNMLWIANPFTAAFYAIYRNWDFLTRKMTEGLQALRKLWEDLTSPSSWKLPTIPGIKLPSLPPLPSLPHFHSGIDRVPGTPGSEVLSVLQAGERVTPAGRADTPARFVFQFAPGGRPAEQLFGQLFEMAVRSGHIQVRPA